MHNIYFVISMDLSENYWETTKCVLIYLSDIINYGVSYCKKTFVSLIGYFYFFLKSLTNPNYLIYSSYIYKNKIVKFL